MFHYGKGVVPVDWSWAAAVGRSQSAVEVQAAAWSGPPAGSTRTGAGSADLQA